MNVAYNEDCLSAMRKMEDNAFDLAVVDPPYGNALTDESGGGKPWNRFGERFDRYKLENRPSAQYKTEAGTRTHEKYGGGVSSAEQGEHGRVNSAKKS